MYSWLQLLLDSLVNLFYLRYREITLLTVNSHCAGNNIAFNVAFSRIDTIYTTGVIPSFLEWQSSVKTLFLQEQELNCSERKLEWQSSARGTLFELHHLLSNFNVCNFRHK